MNDSSLWLQLLQSDPLFK